MTVSKEELQKFYDAHKSQMEQPEQIRLSELLVSTEKERQEPAADDAQQLAAAKAKADDLLAQIRKGAAFDEVAKKNRTDPQPPRVAISVTSSAARWPRNSRTRPSP